MRFILLLVFTFVLSGCSTPRSARTTRISSDSLLTKPFGKEILAFRRSDSLHQPAAHAIIFTGSSSFTNWKDVADYFPGYTIINRGFGGSSLPHLIQYVDDVVFLGKPKQIVIYCGENDFTFKGTTAQMVFERFVQLHQLIRSHLKKTPIAFISIKPSPSRWPLWPSMQEANRLIRDYINRQKNMQYIDVVPGMLNEAGRPKPAIFLKDSLHMNSQGYQIWKQAIQPYLK